MKGYTLMNSPEFVPYSVLARWIIGGLVSLLAVATCAGGALIRLSEVEEKVASHSTKIEGLSSNNHSLEIELIKIQIELQAQRRILNSIASSLNVKTLTR